MSVNQELLTLIQSVGAPTVIAILVIIRIEKRLDNLQEAILNFPRSIAQAACDAPAEQCVFRRAREN